MRDIYLTIKGHGWWLAVLPAAGFALAAALAATGSRPHLMTVYLIFEVLLPLGGAAAVAPFPAAHLEAGAGELELACPAAPLRRALLGVAPGLALLAMAALAAAAWLHASYMAIDPRALVQAAVPPLAALAGLAAAAAALGRSTLAGLGAPFLLWATDLLTRGDVNQWAYLFPVRYPGRALPPELLAAWQAEMHRGALLLGAAGLLLACWLVQRRPRWVR